MALKSSIVISSRAAIGEFGVPTRRFFFFFGKIGGKQRCAYSVAYS